jgi:glycosyltransferase involved in cell wall biosynthesis
MATGVPVVTTTGGAIPEIAGQAAVTVTPGDVQELAAAISDMLENENSRSALIASGLERSQKFTWEATAQDMLALYASLI